MKSQGSATLIALPLLLAVTPALPAQEIDGDPMCPDCVIQFDLVTTIGSLQGADWFTGEPRSIARDSRGRLYLAFPEDGNVLVFDSAGQPLGAIGRTGDGPGEYRRPYLVRVGHSDSILVLDGSYRVSVVDASGRFVRRTGALVEAGDLRLLGDGSLVFSGSRIASAGGGPGNALFHVLDFPGTAVSSSFHTIESEDGSAPRFLLAPAREPDRFWAVYRSGEGYEVLQYGNDGTRQRRFARSPSWMHSLPPEDGFPAPRPNVRGVHAAADGQVWVMGRHAVDDWTPYWNRELLMRSEQVGRNLVESAKLYRSVVEVLDIESGRLVTLHGVPGLVLDFLPDQHVATYREDDAGTPFIDVFRMSVSVPEGAGEPNVP